MASHRNPTTAALSLLGLVTFVVTGPSAEPLLLPAAILPPPAPTAGCKAWDLYMRTLVEKHREAGLPDSALEEAISLSYAAYAKCVMCTTDQGVTPEAVALRERFQLALARGRTLALAD